MQPLPIAHARFNRVAEGMAKIKNRPQDGFALVLRNGMGLEFARALTGVGNRLRVQGAQSRRVLFAPFTKLHIDTQAVIDAIGTLDRKSAVYGKRVSVRVELGGRRFIKK